MIANNLKIFIQVADKKSITAVANENFISQPAVSKAIQTLEQQLNLKLFHRDKHNGLILTEVGEKILILARQMENLENRIFQTAFNENNFIGGNLKIASVPVVTTNILSKALKIYKKNFPQVNVKIFEGKPSEIEKMLENYFVDFAITYSPFGNFESEILLEDKMVAIIPREKNFSCINIFEDIEEKIFCRAAFEIFEKEFARNKIEIGKYFLVQNSETVVRMVEEKIGIGIISEFTLSSLRHELKIIPIEPKIETQIGIIAKSFKNLTPVAKEFIKITKNL